MKMMRHAAEMILPLFYPVRCPVCHDIVLPRGHLICPSCAGRPDYTDAPVCMQCGRPVPEGEELCRECIEHPKCFDMGVSLMSYDGIGQGSIRQFKENGRQEYAKWYAAELMARHGDALTRFGADAIVPVPLHCNRLRQRGYNQAAVIGRELGKRLGVPVKEVLRRTRDTGRQKKLGPEARGRNLLGSFVADSSCQDLDRVILTDDIYTTGSTANACALILKDAGVRKVCVVTVCIAGVRR